MINRDEKLRFLNEISSDTLMEHLGIKYTEVGDDYLVAEMPVSSKHYQPMRVLHGGATLALAESTGSALSVLHVDLDLYDVKGMEINANHISSVKKGILSAKAKFVHKGKTSHVIEIKILNEENKLISICRLTNVLLKRLL